MLVSNCLLAGRGLEIEGNRRGAVAGFALGAAAGLGMNQGLVTVKRVSKAFRGHGALSWVWDLSFGLFLHSHGATKVRLGPEAGNGRVGSAF